MSYKFKQTFSKGVNTDLDELHLPADAVSFIKNLTANVNVNPSAPTGMGSNMDTWTPLEGNFELSIDLPDGRNHCVGFYPSEDTNEGYFLIWNSLNNYTVWVIDGNTGATTLVYQKDDLPFMLDPAYFIKAGRITLEQRSYVDPVTKQETTFKFLIFTNGNAGQYFISVSDSIATNSFTAAPYFNGAGTFYDPKTLVTLGVPTPLSTIEITPVTPTSSELVQQNQIARTGFQFRVKFIDVFGRESVHGIISDVWAAVYGGGCADGGSDSPRCVDISFDAGNPYVDYIQIEYRKWVGNDPAGALQGEWVKYDTITKWLHADGQQWYERSANSLYYDTTTNKITYRFCGNKGSNPIPVEETNIIEPGVPRESSTVASINKRLVLGNNVRGFDPILQSEMQKISFGTLLPETAPCDPPPLRKIVVYAAIFRPFTNQTGIVRGSGSSIVFGNADAPCGTLGTFAVDQVFGDQDTPGFIGYLAGTNYMVVSTQGDLDYTTGVFTATGYGSGTSVTNNKVQRFEFYVPAGKYVFRIASHKSAMSDGAALQQTSTSLAGICRFPIDFAGAGVSSRYSYAREPLKEIEIDVTCGDYVVTGATGQPLMMILDMGSSAVSGYLYDEPTGVPVEMNPVYIGSTAGGSDVDAYGSFFTDHNGFYFAFCQPYSTDSPYVRIYSDFCDGSGPSERLYLHIVGAIGMMYGDGSGTPSRTTCDGQRILGNYLNKVYLTSETYPDCARRVINLKINQCDTVSSGVAGILGVMTKGPISISDSGGHMKYVVHNRYDYATTYATLIATFAPPLYASVPDYSAPPASSDYIVLGQRGSCYWSKCTGSSCAPYAEGCTPSVDDIEVEYVDCSACPTPGRTTNLADQYIRLSTVGIKGVQTGGRYRIGIKAWDNLGRGTDVQLVQGDGAYVNSQFISDFGYRNFGLPSIAYVIDPSFVLPSYFKKLTFYVSGNLAFSDFITWRPDYIQFVDSTGLTNNINPRQIRIYYGSLNEYKKFNNNTVNCAWQFISSGSSVVGDIVQFFMNGDGSWFGGDHILSAPVTYDNTGLFFTIDFQEELRGLVNGALIRIIRPTSNTDDVIMYEQSLVIDLEDGRVPAGMLSGLVPYSDSYMLSRLIPVPIAQGQPGPLPPGGTFPNDIVYTSTSLNPTLESEGYATDNVANNNGVMVMSVYDTLTSSPFYFESPSPSDFWGSHISNRGRIGVVNPYQREQRAGTEVCMSAAFGERSILNGLSYFETKNVYYFDRNTWGDILLILVEVGRCLFICKSDHFMSTYNYTQVSLGENGQFSAQNQYGPFTQPSRPPGTPYGCSYQNLPSVAQYKGIVMWLDNGGRLIRNNFSESIDVSTTNKSTGVVGGYSGYLMSKIATMNIINRTEGNLMYPVAEFDPWTEEYNLTFFQVAGASLAFGLSYGNNQPNYLLSTNETLLVDMQTGLLKGCPAYTPEMYGRIPGFFSGRNMFSFKLGTPWKHHKGASSDIVPYANFYGTQYPIYVIPVANIESETVKRFLWLEIYSKQSIAGNSSTPSKALFYCPSITSEKGQTSRLAPLQFSLRNGFQTAAFLCATNTPADPNKEPMTTTNAITDGDPLMGRYLQMVIKSNDEWEGSYFEMSAIITGLNGIKKSGDQSAQ